MKPHTSKLRPRAGFRWIAIAVVSLVLGLWGVYDYAIKIPGDAAKHERFQIAMHVAAALEEASFSAEGYRTKADTARQRIDAEFERLGEQPDELPERSEVAASVDQLRSALSKADKEHLDAWLTALAVYRRGLDSPTRLGSTLSGWAAIAWELTQPVINAFGSVTPPAAFDRLIQWAFILCLPFFPWYMLIYIKASRKQYRLTEVGELHLPGNQTWPLENIAGIDMSRWMSKSIATVRHTSGRTETLDDHIYKDLHIIVGQLAHHFEPDTWNEDATMIRKPAAADDADDTPAQKADDDHAAGVN